MPKSPIVGTAYVARSKNLANNLCINLYLESVETKEGSSPNALLPCPGLVTALTLGVGPIRAAKTVGTTLYVVSGNAIFAVYAGLEKKLLGTLGSSSGQVYIEYNDVQVGFFDQLGLMVWTPATSTLSFVTLPFTGTVGMPASLDTLTLLTQPGTYNIWQCNENDLTTWDPLNFTTEDGNAEPVVGLAAIHDQVIVLKQFSACFYVNEGNNGFSFGRLDGLYAEVGCVTASSIVTLGESVIFLGQAFNEQPKVYLLRAYEPQAVSTYAIDLAIEGYPTSTDATGFGYSQDGHLFYVLNFPSGNQTWVFDTKETGNLSVPVWHARAAFGSGAFSRYAGSCAAAFGGAIYMGDWQNGNLYTLDLNSYQDNGQTRKWVRSWQALGANVSVAPQKINYLDLQMDTGVGVPAGTNPQLMFRQSFDGGYSWSNDRLVSVGTTGEYQNDIRITRLGATKRGLNSARIFHLSGTDVWFNSLLGADVG
jgi:hypothetical protein